MNFRFLACLRIPVAVALLTFLTAPGVSFAARKKVAVVRVATAKLRSAPSESKRAIGLLDRGDSFAVVDQSRGWVKIRTESGRIGWVRSDLVRLKTAPKTAAKPQVAKKSVSEVKPARDSARGRSATRPVASPAVRVTKTNVEKTTAEPRAVVSPSQRAAQGIVSRSADTVPDSVKTAVVASPPSGSMDPSESETAEFLPMVAEPEVALETPVDRIGRARVSIVEDALSVYRQENTVNRSTTSRTALVSRAKSLRGTPYRFGSTGRGSFDCSGFTQHLYRRQGLQIPRTAAEQYHFGSAVGRMSLRQGDLVFFRNTGGRRGISHVGLFLGSGRFIHASSRGGGVRIDSLTESYYANHFAGARRVLR
jgi:cell wall-associated NlpC family hydrolase